VIVVILIIDGDKHVNFSSPFLNHNFEIFKILILINIYFDFTPDVGGFVSTHYPCFGGLVLALPPLSASDFLHVLGSRNARRSWPSAFNTVLLNFYVLLKQQCAVLLFFHLCK